MFDTMMIGNKIKQARVEQNMTQMNLADAMGVSYQAVSNWERGNSMPDISKLGDLCKVLNLSVNALLGLEENVPNAVTKAMDQEPITMEELAEVAPILPPEEIKERVKEHSWFGPDMSFLEGMKGKIEAAEKEEQERRKQGKTKKRLDLSRIAEIAPFLDSDYLDKLVREADLGDLEGIEEIAPFLRKATLAYLAEQIELDDLDEIVDIVPFLDRESVDLLVSRCTEVKNFSALEELAPFVSRETMDILAEKVTPESIWEVVSLAPFFSKQALDCLVRRCGDWGDYSAVEELAPFLSRETLDAMVDRYIETGSDEDLSDFYPFLSGTTMRKLAEYQLRRGDPDELEDMIPFM